MNSEPETFDYFQMVSAERQAAIEALEPYKKLIIAVKHYRDLLALPKAALNKLVAYKEIVASEFEHFRDDAVAATGGHHRDMLDICRHVLAGDTHPQGCYVYLNNVGSLNVSLARIFNEADENETGGDGGDGGPTLRLAPVPHEEAEYDEKPLNSSSLSQ